MAYDFQSALMQAQPQNYQVNTPPVDQGPVRRPQLGNPRPMGIGGSVPRQNLNPQLRTSGPPEQYGPAALMPGAQGHAASNQRSVMPQALRMPDLGGVYAGRGPAMNAVQQARQSAPPPGFNPNDPANAALAAYGQR